MASIPAAADAPAATIHETLDRAAAQTDAFLSDFLSTQSQCPAPLMEAIRYSLLGPGKRIRPALAILCARAVGGNQEDAMPAAGAVELIHCFSLVHDDLPAMDDDDLRRGRPTNHKVFGDALAILAGDAMNTLAFELLAVGVPDARLALALSRELAVATGAQGMIGGQVLDTCHPRQADRAAATLADLQRVHRMKTGALINAACRMGALSGRATPAAMNHIDAYGKAIGLMFQIVDDLLDVTATAEQLGKRTGKDAEIGKLTYPSLLGLDATRRHLTEQLTLSINAAAALGPDAAKLADLAHMLAARSK